MSEVGFTGTRHGMTAEQKLAMNSLIAEASWIHHGDCVGADGEAVEIAHVLNVRTACHPPIDNSMRANTLNHWFYLPMPYLARNRNIVDATERLIAAPAEEEEQQRGGTWSTIRYARRKGKPVLVVLPSGKVVEWP